MMKYTHYYIIGCLWALMMLLPSPSGMAHAQKRKVMNRPYVDQRKFHYGFLAGMHLQDIELEQNGFVNEVGDQWFAETPNYEPGFSVGILGEFYLTKHLGLRIIPTMHLHQKRHVPQRNEWRQTVSDHQIDILHRPHRHQVCGRAFQQLPSIHDSWCGTFTRPHREEAKAVSAHTHGHLSGSGLRL